MREKGGPVQEIALIHGYKTTKATPPFSSEHRRNQEAGIFILLASQQRRMQHGNGPLFRRPFVSAFLGSKHRIVGSLPGGEKGKEGTFLGQGGRSWCGGRFGWRDRVKIQVA